jgi:lipopolysaccharide transport system ATP-binding protein
MIEFNRMIRIHLHSINLHFRVRKCARTSLKAFVLNGLFRRDVNPYLEIHALRDINLDIEEGQRVGIVGPNGAGKSTLLRLLAGVYWPSSGERQVHGKISSLMDINLGIEPNASGWDNIAYRCYLQGDSPAEVEAKRPEIAEFCELGDYLDMPARYYSRGMYVRFAFAIATAVEPEILLLDEVFSAGDKAFQQKARERMASLIDKARLMVFVSHDLATMADLCNRVIWMEKGAIIADGNPAEILERYSEQQQQTNIQAA